MYSLFSNDFSASVSGSACYVQRIGFYVALLDLAISLIGRWLCLYLTGFGGRPDEGRAKSWRKHWANPKDSPRWFPRYLEYMIFSNSSSALSYESILYIFQEV